MEYIDLVNKIISAEHSAKEIAREAKERETTLDADLEREAARMREAYLDRARRRVEQVRATETQAAQESIAALDAKFALAMDAVEAAYAKNRDAWVEAIFQRIAGTQA
ncbi:hypothetical protein CE91St41_09630 [Oscillospiraceae bacterium]|nr:hypothetical protein CE91St40_27900 [Oscillospiraceae bacterium]BDF74074.1 hypothetical protein CE91St41_09630 [Oscillospiraceae bacterium]